MLIKLWGPRAPTTTLYPYLCLFKKFNPFDHCTLKLDFKLLICCTRSVSGLHCCVLRTIVQAFGNYEITDGKRKEEKLTSHSDDPLILLMGST